MVKLVVVGGTGFLGRHICLQALKSGFSVTSVSRNGLSGLKSTPFAINPSLISQIDWKAGDVFNPESYTASLKDADAVVHAVGTAFGNQDYKRFLLTPSIGGFLRFGSAQLKERLGGTNPMKSKDADEFDKMNRQSAVLAAGAFARAGTTRPRSFIYISAESWNPLLSPQYIESKRQAEDELLQYANLRKVFVRPGLMYDEHVGDIRANLACVLKNIPGLPKPLSVQSVSRAVVEACQDDQIDGVVSLKALEKFVQVSASTAQ